MPTRRLPVFIVIWRRTSQPPRRDQTMSPRRDPAYLFASAAKCRRLARKTPDEMRPASFLHWSLSWKSRPACRQHFATRRLRRSSRTPRLSLPKMS